jgi:hypothetical protein
MFGITLKRSIAVLAAAAALLTAAGPASAGTAVGNPGDPPAKGARYEFEDVVVIFMDYTDDASVLVTNGAADDQMSVRAPAHTPGGPGDPTGFTLDVASSELYELNR